MEGGWRGESVPGTLPLDPPLPDNNLAFHPREETEYCDLVALLSAKLLRMTGMSSSLS